MCLFICREPEVILLGFSHVPPTLPSTALLPREKLQVRHSLLFVWSKELYIQAGCLDLEERNQILFCQEENGCHKSGRFLSQEKRKAEKRFQSLSVGLVYCHTRALAACHSAILWVEDCVPGKPESTIVNHYCV